MRAARNNNWWSYIEDMSMERKLFLVFLVIITLPLSFISVISFKSYSESIQANTIAYSEKLIDQMMDSIDDYIEDMKRISSMPAYVNEIKQNLIRSNRYYEQKQMMEGKQDTAQVAPGDLDLLLSIQRGIEENISFINNIKRGTHSVYIFLMPTGMVIILPRMGGVRLDLQQSYRFWSEQVKGSGGEATLLGTQAYTSNLQSTRYAFTVVRPILDGLWKPVGLIAVEANFSNLENQVAELDKVTQGKSILVDQSGKVIYDSEQKLLTADISRSSLFRAAEGSSRELL
ncbi:cache domain-containing protein [Paenibacillus rhizoplanae]